MGIKLLDGRDFSEDFKSDTSSIIINKAGLDLMDLKEPVIGTELDLWGGKRETDRCNGKCFDGISL